MGSITGNQNPKVGEKTQFSINALTTIFSYGAEYEWYIFKKQKNNTWKNITNPIKKGSAVNYTFGEICLGIEIKIEVYEIKQAGLLQSQASKRKIGELIIIPRSNKTPEITKVILFNRGAKDVNKASYHDTLIAQAHCIGLFNQEIEFSLWEDDAKGNGHNAEVNKNNRIPRIYKAKVNANGIAEAKISLAADERILKEIANKYLMHGDSSEGANHEYYVTATYLGKGLKASQVNVEVKNPDANAPRPNSPTFPATPDSTGPRQNDPQARIVNAYFVNSNNQKINKAKVGDKIFVQILSKEMVGKHIQYIIWEFDTGNHDEIYRSPKLKIISDTITHTAGFTITQDIYNKAIDLPIGDPDANNQNYLIEVLALDVNAYSKRFGVTSEGLMKVESGKSPAAVEAQTKQPNTSSSCLCKEQYKDLIWGEKVSCDFRKKVVEISKRQGINPNNFMAAMAHETGGTFDPTCGTFKKHKNEEEEGYVGLIQIGKDAAKSIGIKRTELLKMNQLEQLDYVEKYLAKKKGKLNTLTDFYLAILFPVDCGKGNQPNHIVFDNSLPISYKNGKPIKNLNYWRNVAYSANPAFHKEGKKENGKTYVWEITENIQIWYEKGESNKPKNFVCNNETPISKPSTEKGIWNVIVTEKYTGSKCSHIEKTPIRPNCRRGRIDVYDHSEKIILTISDCLLEGIAGEDRSITDSDAPYGIYQIASEPFIMGSSTGDKRTSYGPNPRLSFEPIKGSGDEADKSGRSLIRIHGGRQENKNFTPRVNPNLLRTHGCIRVWDSDAKKFYDWWCEYHKNNPNIKPGKLTLKK